MSIQNNTGYRPLTEWIRTSRGFLRMIALVEVVFFLFVFYSPSAMAVADTIEESQTAPVIEGKTDEEKLSKTLQAIKENITTTKATVDARMVEESDLLADVLNFFGLSELQTESTDQLLGLNEQLAVLNETALANFAQIEAQLIAKGLPEIILQRHQAMVNQYQTDYQQLQSLIQQSIDAGSLQDQQAAVAALHEFLQQRQFKRSHQPFDPNKLPFGTPDAEKTRKPIVDGDDLSQLIHGDNDKTYFADSILNGILDALVSPAYAEEPTAADLAETLDIEITADMRQLAESLNNNPAEIYAWVHNNIHFIPSYGSIQGSRMTLETQRGNAIDTASLLIALLRAAGIPARYVYGSVEVPADKAMNWVGGVETAGAAQQLLGQGGIPNVARVQGGQVTHIRLEHTWVEAWVDFEPSRGINNIQGDSWVPMDASFKQYDYSTGMNLQQNVPFDAQALVDAITVGTTINEAEGWVQNLPQQAAEDQFSQYQQQLETFINNQNPAATVGDVLGLQQVKIIPARPLSAGLPYKKISTQQTFPEVPDNLRHKFKYQLATQNFGYPGSPIISFIEPTVKLAGKKLALSFKPASADDEAIINSYLPEPDPVTGDIDPAQLPNSLPGYLINLTAEFTLEGTVIQSAGAGFMGGELHETLALWSPASGWDQAVNNPTAGEYRAIGLDLQGVSPEQAAQLQTQAEATKAILESGDEVQFATLTKHEVVGDLLYGTIFSYLALNDVQDKLAALSSGIVQYRLPSFGIFSTRLSTQYWFGLPRNVSFSGLGMDVDHYTYQAVDKRGDRAAWVNYNLMTGARASAMEHLVPEQMFSTVENPAQGISAVKALAIASAEGQRIWTIDQNNLNTALAAINLDADIENEIRSAVNAGKVATTHDTPVAFAGSTVTGYLLIDPATGAGAYKISGGANGAWLFIAVVAFLIAMIIFNLLTRNIQGLFFSLTAYFGFVNRVEDILNSDLSPSQVQIEVERAMAAAVIGSVGGSALSTLAGNDPRIHSLRWLLRAFFAGWNAVWFNY
ncbi:MAG: transglutaminase-like domain-containing protein [Gammaproteobacteria bacterium]|nr:transglutaminase-like domain-containing protein [Gammaproteobacteria bacterium]